MYMKYLIYVNNTPPLALAVHEITRNFWTAYVDSYNETGCSVPPNIARLPSILQCSCANCSEQVAPELASCNYVSLTNFVDFSTFLADFR